MTTSIRLEAALSHAKRGWKIFPLHHPTAEGKCSCNQASCSIGKHPREKNWQKIATSDFKIIQDWWKKYPDSNIGLATGAGSGIIVLDIDGPDGLQTVQDFGTHKTSTVVTGRGRQLYFQHPGGKVKNKVGTWPQLDSRGDGGYVVAPGSLHVNGTIYHWAEGLSPENVPISKAPKWWLDAVLDTPGDPGGDFSPKVNKTAFQDPRNAQKIITGRRNSSLASVAGSLRDKGLSVDAILYSLRDFNTKHCSPPLEDREVQTIAESYGRYEEGNPNKRITVSEIADILREKKKFICSPINSDGCGVHLMIYNGGSFKINGSDIARRMTDKMLGTVSRPETIKSVVEILRERVKINEDMLNPAAMSLINVKNGMLDWKNEKLTDHSPEHLSTIQVQAEYKTEAKSDLLDNFLSEIFPPDALALAEEILGYLMIPSTEFQKAFMLVGEGANGKSTFLNMLISFLGHDHVSRVSLQQLEDSPFAAAELHGKLANIYSDLPGSKLEKSDMFKSIVGGDAIKAEKKYGQPFIMRTTARLMFSANSFPKSSDSTSAYFRRWIIIPFPNKFEGDKADSRLSEKLSEPAVLSALLNKALIGLQRLMENKGFTKCKSSEEQVEEYRIENDSAYLFVKESLETGSGKLSKSDIWERYNMWCAENHIKYVQSQQKLNKFISQVFGAEEYRDSRDHLRYWVGLSYRVKGQKGAKF